MKTITSCFLELNKSDLLKGLLMAVGGAVFAVVAPSIEHAKFVFDFTAIWHTAVAAGFVYLGKNLFTPAKEVKPVEKI